MTQHPAVHPDAGRRDNHAARRSPCPPALATLTSTCSSPATRTSPSRCTRSPTAPSDQYLAMTECARHRADGARPAHLTTAPTTACSATCSSGSARAAAAWSASTRTPPTPNSTRSTRPASARSGSTCSPARAGRPGSIIAYVRRMAARATPRGWHLQFYTPGTIVRDLLPFLADLEDTFVIDHMGYMTESDPGYERRLLDLLAQGSCWIKLSGAYRVAKDKPLSSVAPWGRALVAARPDRLALGLGLAAPARRPARHRRDPEPAGRLGPGRGSPPRHPGRRPDPPVLLLAFLPCRRTRGTPPFRPGWTAPIPRPRDARHAPVPARADRPIPRPRDARHAPVPARRDRTGPAGRGT